eukprot:Amastigsp_a343344_35.p3 type:complete len:111 gc:universal Amastigsp_a343344_35:159-491(+)
MAPADRQISSARAAVARAPAAAASNERHCSASAAPQWLRSGTTGSRRLCTAIVRRSSTASPERSDSRRKRVMSRVLTAQKCSTSSTGPRGKSPCALAGSPAATAPCVSAS